MVWQLLATARKGYVELGSLDFPGGLPIRHGTEEGWVPIYLICRPDTGGLSGDRRLRELKEEGVDIESRRADGKPYEEHRLKPVEGRLF